MDWLLKKSNALYLLLFILLIFDRLNTFIRFSKEYTDSDQTLLWQVAKDLMNGIFHGPCFYGQSYNPVIEAVFALPFLYSGMELSEALPLATTILGIFPFLLLSVYLYKRVDALTGLIPLIILLVLPPEYSMLTSISRGFVTGIFFAVIGFVLIAYHKSLFARFIGGISLGIGIYANPNCVLLFPLMLPFLFSERKVFFQMILPVSLGFLLGLSSFLFNAAYYSTHPDMVIHGSPSIQISFNSFLSVIGRLDSYFDFITPVLWRAGWTSLLLFLIIGNLLWRKKRKPEFYTVIILFFLIVLSFFVSKVSDGTNSVFFSGARMFLAYPYILIFVFIYWLTTLSLSYKRNVIYIMSILALVSFGVKLFAFDYFLNNALKGSKNSIVKVIKVNELRNICIDLLNFSGGNTDLILAISKDTPDQVITYGCPCLIQNFPATIQPLYERRRWLIPNIEENVYEKVLLHSKDTTIWNNIRLDGLKIIKRNKLNGWLLIENQLNTLDLLYKTGLITAANHHSEQTFNVTEIDTMLTKSPKSNRNKNYINF